MGEKAAVIGDFPANQWTRTLLGIAATYALWLSYYRRIWSSAAQKLGVAAIGRYQL
jgi:hypothetical protein